MARCFFCKEGKNLGILPGDNLSRLVYEDDICRAVLEMEQSVTGYTLLMPKNHYDTILDSSIPDEELNHFWRIAQRIGQAIKNTFRAENVYIASLCDGINHFHIHLIPRYKWTEKDKERYRELFTARDGKESVKLCTSLDMIGGFWYMADTEREYKNTEYGSLPKSMQFKTLDLRARQLRECMK